MNKFTLRIFTLVLSIVLLFSCVFSVSADSEFYSIDLLEYVNMDNSDDNHKSYSNQQVSFFYDLPFNSRLYQCQIFLKSGTTDSISTFNITDSSGYTYEPELLYLSEGYYRVLFNLRGNYVTRLNFDLTFSSTSRTYIQILDFDISPIVSSVFNPSFNAYISWYTPGNNLLDRSFLGVNSFIGEEISCVAYRVDLDFTDEWQKYDYIDLSLSLAGCTIDSVNVMLSDNTSVPFELKEIVATTADTVKTTYTFMLNIDLTSVVRDGDLYVLIRGSGGQTDDSIKVQSISVNSCKSFVRSDSFSNPFVFWLNRIWQALKPSGSETAADDFKDKVDEQSSELEDIKDSLDSVEKPNAADINMNIDTYVPPSDLTIATSGLSTILNNEIMIKILLMVITFAIVGFILYGKR